MHASDHQTSAYPATKEDTLMEDSLPYSALNSLKGAMVAAALEIAKNIEEKLEPIEKLETINQQLNDHHESLRAAFASDESGLMKADFYAKVFKGISDKMLKETLLSKPTILKFFRNVLVNYFPYDVEDEHLAEVVHSIFNLDAHLYSQALPENQKKVSIQWKNDLDGRVQHGNNNQGDNLESLEQQRLIAEHQWRASLQVDSRLEAVKTRHVQQYQISGWARGHIQRYLNDDPDTFLVTFDNEPSSSDQIINRYGPQLAPEGTFTDDIQWREDLKVGDEIDCLDSEGVWYRSTTLETREAEHDGIPFKQIHVGFRVYDDEEGHKVDDDGRKFVGWSNRYDEWRSLACVSVQRLKTMVKHYKVAGRNFMTYDQMIEDLRDVIQNTKERKIWTIYRHGFFANLRCIADYLNEFGMRGGFERILSFLQVHKDNRKVSLKHIQYLLDFLSKGQPLWHRQFACYFVPAFKENFEKLLLYTNQANTGPLQLNFAKETLNSIQKSYQSILKRYYTIDTYGNILSELQFEIGFSLLKSDKLEKRISGIKEIIEQIKNSKFQMKKTISTQDIIQKLKAENFCEKIFGENYHIQLIQRSTEILRFLINERQLGQQEIDYIWSATQRDQQTKMEIYKIIQDTAILYKGEEIEHFMTKFMSVPPDEFVEKEIECAYELTRFSYKQNSYSQKAAELFWNIATRKKPYKKQIVELASEKFNDLIRNWDKEQKGEFVYLCIENIKDHKATLQSIKILIKLLDQVPQYKQGNNQTIYELSNALIDDFHLIDLIVSDLIQYLKQANDLWYKGVLTPENIETTEVFDLPYTHRANIYFRLNLIRQLLSYSHRQLQQDHLDLLWEEMTQTSQILPDTDSFFMWLKYLLSDQNKLTPEIMRHFFSHKICKEGVSFKQIKKYGFECIQSMFLQINELQDKIVLNNPQTLSHNTTNNQIGMHSSMNMSGINSSSYQAPTNLDFKILVPPNQLEGINALWKLLEEVDKKNMDLISVIVLLITKVYLNLSSVIEEQIHVIGEQFTQECLTRLSHVINDQDGGAALDKESFQDKAQFAKNLAIMMKSFFEDSERNGTGGLRPHLAIERGDFIQRVVIQNNVTSQKICPKYIEVSTYSNMTLWELKKVIALKTKVSPLKLQLNRQDTKKKVLTDNDNIKLLKDLKFESYEQIIAQKKPMTFINKVSLVNRKQELVPEAKRIFESWFDTFSTDEGFMTHDTCVDFIKNSTNDPNVTTGDQRVTRLFTEYDKDKDGKLSREDFLEFYRDRAVQKPDLVWSNLSAHQFGNDLKHLSYGLYDDDDPAELKDKTHLARYKISSNEDQFELLFDMMEKGYDDIWNTIICQLRTNPKMYADLLTLNGVAQLSQERSHKLLYSLQIMEYFLTEYQVKRSCELKCYYYTEAAASVQQEYPPLPNESNSAPQSGYNGGAIPLPAAQARVNHNIPDAPPIHMGPLPPPSMAGMAGNNGNKGKDNKIYEVLDAFPGSVIHEDLNTELFSNDELTPYFQGEVINSKYLREQWVPTFLQNGGFQLLIQMLTQAMQRQTQKAKEDILSAQVDKECVNSLLRIMKIILMSSFCANSPNLELKEQMQRRMSNIVEEEIDLFDEKKNSDAAVVEPAAAVDNQIAGFSEQQSKILSEQEQTTKEYEPLIHLLIGDLGQAILGSLDFQAYQDLILRIVQLVLNKEKEIKVDDRAIVDQSLQLWISCIVFKPSLLELIYENEAAASDLENGRLPSQVSSISRVLIEKGLLAQNYAIRGQFKDSLLFICKQVTNESIIKHLPQLYFLNALINNLDLTLNRSKDAKQYFELLKALFALHFEQRKANHPMGNQDDSDLQTTNLFKYISTRLTAYVSTEKKGQYTEDYNLSGLIDILTLLMNNHQAGEAFSENVYEALIVEIIETLLFTFDMPPIETHITKEVDLQKLEKAYLNKCQSTDSRQAAYNLLITIVKECPQHLGTIMSKYWYALLYKVKKPKKQGYAPKSEGRSYHGYCGIKNLGCICYMNSMIQQFFHIPTFRYCALAADDREAENMKDFEGDAVDDNMLHQLMKFMGFLELSERQDYNPREFCFSFKDSGGQPTNVRIQQDAQEFLNVAFDRIESQLAKTSQKYLLQNVFGGKTCSMMICKSCGNLRQKFEDFFNLSVEVKNQKTLYDGLKKFISGEIINDFQCEACGQRVDVMKKTVIQKLPNTLIVHLQRIVFDFETMQNSKLNSRVEFPNVLNLKPFMLAEALKEEKEVMKAARKEKKKQEGSHKMESSSSERQEKMEDEKDEESQMTRNQSPDKQQTDTPSSDDEDEDTAMEQDDADENYEYKLVGVVVHMGTADAGHYISYININRGTKPEESPEWLKTESDKWLEFNDSQVKDYKFKDLEEDCFGGIHSSLSTGVHVGVGGGANDFKNDYSRNAYMLIYEKRRKEQIKLVIPESLLLPSQRDQLAQYQQALDCDGTTIPRGSVSLPLSNGSQFQPPHLLFICPEVGTKLLQDRDILYDDESKEHYVLADFNGIQKFVPNSVYKQVHEDNSLFMCERHIFHNSFFSCTKQMLELVISKVPELLLLEDYSSKLYDFMERMIFDLISMTSENKQLGQLTQLLINMLKQNDERTLSFIKKRILTMPGEGNEKPKETSEKKGALSEKSFFEMLISNMEKDVRDMAQALLTFAVNRLFELNDVAQLDQIMDTVFAMMPEELSKNWLKIHQYLTFLFDVTKSGRPQLEYMVRVGLVTKLIDFYLENDSPKAAAGVGVPRRNQMGSNYANPPFESLIMTLCYIAQHQTVFPANTKMSQQEYAGQVHHFLEEKGPSPIFLKQADNYSLILNTEDIEMLFLKQFYAKTLKYGYVTMNLGYLLAHISYENYEFSFKIAKKLLIGINKCNGDDIRPHLEALEPFLYLQDSLSRHRLEWILGVPVIKIERGIHYNSNNMVAGGGPASTSLNLPRVGVQVVSNMNDDIYEYRSTLFKSSTGIKESLLQILFQHRKRWALYTLQCIQSLFKVALFDKDRKIFNYMKTLEPPTYSYGRYIDWIKPYLEDTIQSNMRTQHMHSSKMELQMAMQLFSQLGALLNPVVNAPPPKGDQDKKADQVIEEVKETQDVPEQAQINYLHHDASDGGPEQYLIYRATGEVSRDMRTYQAENITVQVTELQAMISESKPTAHGNLILANNNNGSSFQLQPQQMNGGSSNGRNQGRGNQASQRKQNKDKKRGGGNRGGKGKKSVVCKEQPQTQSIYEGYYPAEDNEMGDNASTEGVQADQDNTMAVDEEGGTLPQDVREGEGIQGDVGGACEDGEYEEEEIEEYDENTHDPGSRQEQFQDEEQRSNNNNIMDFQQDRDHDQDQDHPNQGIVPPTVAAHKDDDYWQANVSAVLIFTVTNHHPVKSLKVVFTFKDESKEGETLNFKLPVTPVVVQVHSNRDKEVIAFTKLRPFDDWGQYSFTARVDVPADKNQNRSFFPHGPSADYAMDTTPASNVSMNQPDLNQKECPTCTFYNAPFLSICEMCATQLPP